MSETKQDAPNAPKRERTRGKSKQAKTRRVTPTITMQEALELLESAVSYCQLAGLRVRAANQDDGALAVFIPNAHYILTDDGTRAAFRLGALTQ